MAFLELVDWIEEFFSRSCSLYSRQTADKVSLQLFNPHHQVINHLYTQKGGEKMVSRADLSSLSALDLQGSILFDNFPQSVTHDFGNICHDRPVAVVHPASEEDISDVVRAIGRSSNLTVAARGNGHSINGQAQALNGVVIDMSTLRGIDICVEGSYADVYGGELWIHLLQACLRKGLAPRSWADYLHLSVGGILQNAGVGGQTFKHGPQISNVLQLEIVTGKGDMVKCSPTYQADLFYASLGGLGQFGIITKARIMLEPAPQKVRWIRAVYADFKAFTQDQEMLISRPKDKTFDYLEGFVVANSNDPVNGWGQIPLTPDRSLDPNLIPLNAGLLLYCLEVAAYYTSEEAGRTVEEKAASLLASLRFIKGLVFTVDVSYYDFLNRVSPIEKTLRSLGIWQAPHPWLCLFIPRSQIQAFDSLIFRQSLTEGVGGPMLLYPMNKNKWDSRCSAALPEEEDMFYLVGLLRSNFPYPNGPRSETLVGENNEILRKCKAGGIHVKQYLPHFKRQSDWEGHFGAEKWRRFGERKRKYDPEAILAPGQRIFNRKKKP